MSADQELALTGASVVPAAVGAAALGIGGAAVWFAKKGAKSARKADETPTNETQ